MFKLRFLSNLCLLSLVLFISSCKVEGPAGPAGEDGVDGNANVRTQIIRVATTDWQGGPISGYEAQKAASIVTQNIVDSGVVLCYLKQGSRYYSIPSSNFVVIEDDGGLYAWTRHFIFSHSLNAVQFTIQDDDGETVTPSSQVEFKIVAISSSEVVASINTKDYYAVAAALGI